MSTKMIPLTVDGTLFELTVQDYGTHWKVRVYQNGKVIGVSDQPIRVGIDTRMQAYIVKRILRGQHDKEARI
ncbi:MAG: hypothetical protein HC840_00485 [Leptolyngbyaceae cyanobacterium RM2_2_4]|nr:hypothetical protein [Leptolyngbyaceae cyanobacterium RM2_2_4]